MTSEGLVFVTGASGFLGKHVVFTLLQAGHSVRASVRAPAMAEQVRKAVAPHLDPDGISRLSFVTLDLTRDEGWGQAMEGATALFHTASPFPIEQPKDPEEVIRPAVDAPTARWRPPPQLELAGSSSPHLPSQ